MAASENAGFRVVFTPSGDKFACLPPQSWRGRVPRKAQLLLAEREAFFFFFFSEAVWTLCLHAYIEQKYHITLKCPSVLLNSITFSGLWEHDSQ